MHHFARPKLRDQANEARDERLREERNEQTTPEARDERLREERNEQVA
jgi:hypothetical protein